MTPGVHTEEVITVDHPRQAVTDSLRHLVSPIPGLQPNRRRGRTVFIGGGCLVWLLLGWVFLLWYLIVVVYVAAVVVGRLLLVLGALAWWGVDGLVGVIGRRRR